MKPQATTRRRSKTNPETDLPARILKHLETLGVSLTQEHLNQTLHQAENRSCSHLEFLERLEKPSRPFGPLRLPDGPRQARPLQRMEGAARSVGISARAVRASS